METAPARPPPRPRRTLQALRPIDKVDRNSGTRFRRFRHDDVVYSQDCELERFCTTLIAQAFQTALASVTDLRTVIVRGSCDSLSQSCSPGNIRTRPPSRHRPESRIMSIMVRCRLMQSPRSFHAQPAPKKAKSPKKTPTSSSQRTPESFTNGLQTASPKRLLPRTSPCPVCRAWVAVRAACCATRALAAEPPARSWLAPASELLAAGRRRRTLSGLCAAGRRIRRRCRVHRRHQRLRSCTGPNPKRTTEANRIHTRKCSRFCADSVREMPSIPARISTAAHCCI